MATINNLRPPQTPDPPGLYIGIAPVARRRAALALLLTGRPRQDDPAVVHFEQFAREQNLNLDQLWVACTGGREGHLAACILLVPNPGATAMLFVGPSAGWGDHALVIRLIRRACSSDAVKGVRVVQALLDPGQVLEAQVIEQAGLSRLAKLIYMQRAITPREYTQQLPTELGTVPITSYQPESGGTDRFARAIRASYVETLDCPGLLGLRSIDQVIESHRATGIYDPSLWHAFYDADDQPVAVLLLSEVAQGGAHEVVYLGVAKPVRGRGIAGHLMRYALAETARRGGTRLYLAVDDRNAPAVKLYTRLGFRATARKCAYILSC